MWKIDIQYDDKSKLTFKGGTSAMYKMIFDDGEIRMLVATDLSYEQCLELRKEQLKPECYEIIAI